MVTLEEIFLRGSRNGAHPTEPARLKRSFWINVVAQDHARRSAGGGLRIALKTQVLEKKRDATRDAE